MCRMSYSTYHSLARNTEIQFWQEPDHDPHMSVLHPLLLALTFVSSIASYLTVWSSRHLAVDAQYIQISESGALLVTTVSGAFMGAVVSVCLFRDKESRWLTGRKIVGSAFAAMLLTPALFWGFSIEPTQDHVWVASGMIAMVAWPVLRKVLPMIPGMAARRLKTYEPKEPDTDP